MRQPKVAPSLLSGDFARLADEAAALEAQGADWLHVDVMDGHFVPNLTLGPPVVKSLRRHTQMVLDCHLMVSDPEVYAPQFAEAGADRVTFHVEACEDARALIAELKGRGVEVGLAVKPGTPLDETLALAEAIDMLLIMTVEPGFGGQSFMEGMMAKVRQAAEALPERVDIQVDGGIDAQTAAVAAAAGANVFVSGSAVFKAPDRAAMIAAIREAARRGLAGA